MSALAGGEYHTFLFFIELPALYAFLPMLFSSVFCFFGHVEHTGVSSSYLQPYDNSLMAAVNLLEANWISIQEIFELASRVLTRIFIGLWPK
jgi:hypothetical protein